MTEPVTADKSPKCSKASDSSTAIATEPVAAEESAKSGRRQK